MEIAQKPQRNGEEVSVGVKYPENNTSSKSLRNFRLQGSGEAEILLDEVVTLRDQQGFSSITRENGRREVATLDDARLDDIPPFHV